MKQARPKKKQKTKACTLGRILNLESTTRTCSVSLTEDGKLTGLRESHDSEYRHAELLNVYMEQLITEYLPGPALLDAISVAGGPGSYTGLRIGVSSAKGLCYALKKPLIAVDPLEAVALGCIMQNGEELNATTAICAMIDARRDEVFMAVYDHNRKLLQAASAAIITSTFFDNWKYSQVILTGEGSVKFSNLFSHHALVRVLPVMPSAAYNGILAEEKYRQKEFADVAYFEPFYGKEFQTSTPRK